VDDVDVADVALALAEAGRVRRRVRINVQPVASGRRIQVSAQVQVRAGHARLSEVRVVLQGVRAGRAVAVAGVVRCDAVAREVDAESAVRVDRVTRDANTLRRAGHLDAVAVVERYRIRFARQDPPDDRCGRAGARGAAASDPDAVQRVAEVD
jgi:hypothetical protein